MLRDPRVHGDPASDRSGDSHSELEARTLVLRTEPRDARVTGTRLGDDASRRIQSDRPKRGELQDDSRKSPVPNQGIEPAPDDVNGDPPDRPVK